MRILIIDDEKMQRDILQGFLDKQGYQTLTAADGKEALRLFEEVPVHLVLIDQRMPDMTGDQVIEQMKKTDPFVKIIMITAHGCVDIAVRVMKQGAHDFLEKPVDLAQLLDKIRTVERELEIQEEAGEVESAVEQARLPLSIVGSGKKMQSLLSLVVRIAPTRWPAIIRGETGTGKELVARLIHLMGPRKDHPFVAVNCAAIPENLFESELFGHEKGAFTGASALRRGRFELAHTGTLFLDEVGELPLQLQAKLLRTLQENRIARVGSETDIPVDTRILTATNRDLKKMVARGRFREDLYFRLNVLELVIPPLRERREDIPELIDHFLTKYAARPLKFDPDALNQMVKYEFPGNVRELEHLIQRLSTLVRGSVIHWDDLPSEIREKQPGSGLLEEHLAGLEKHMLVSALRSHDWVQTRAAESLGISERVLRYKMKKAGISPPGKQEGHYGN
jgi:two-component system response regulator AtoC